MKWSIRHAACIAVLLCLGAIRGQAAEFGAYTPYYEDDGWLDISEWMDGNDYNPTDEAWWRWDDETYESSEDISGDVDNDLWYGYSDRDSNDWYYDYYDPYAYSYYDWDDNDLYEYGYRYYDFDNDGFYDAFASYSDSDNDGLYEDFDYYSFSQTGSDQQKQQASQSAARNSRPQTVTGQIQRVKQVQVRGKQQHLVVAIQPQGQQSQQQQNQQSRQRQGQRQQGRGNEIIADLGKVQNLQNANLKEGDKITVKGPRARIGSQTVVLAQSVNAKGQNIQVNRDPRNFTGQVTDTHLSDMRGQQHLIAMVQLQGSQPGGQNRQAGSAQQQGQQQKVAVDLGRKGQLNVNVQKGSTLTFNGFPVKVNDKPMVIAKSIQADGQLVQINRQPSAIGGSGSPGGTQQGQSQGGTGQTNAPSSSNESQNSGGSSQP